ncbi:MAG: glyoxalase [Eubacteriales bacterium]|nr:glyoxalase [Eubacteriales bacterium]
MQEYDAAVIRAFLENQERLFPKPVAENEEDAEAFLEDVCAVVAGSAKEVAAYFEEECIDLEGEDPLDAAEVFAVGDGRYLIVEG